MTFRRVAFTPVPPGPKPGFDHADTYLAPTGSRIYIAHTGADPVEVLDCRSGAYLRALSDLPGVAGVLIDSVADLLFTSDRAVARVSVFRCSDAGQAEKRPSQRRSQPPVAPAARIAAATRRQPTANAQSAAVIGVSRQ